MTSIPKSFWVLHSFNGAGSSKNQDFLWTNPRIRFTTVQISSCLYNSDPKPFNSSEKITGNKPAIPDSVKLALERAKAYKKSKKLHPNPIPTNPIPEPRKNQEENSGKVVDSVVESDDEVPLSVKLALQKAREYKENKGIVGGGRNFAEVRNKINQLKNQSGLQGNSLNEGNGVEENSDMGNEAQGRFAKPGESISSINFVGLDFSEKKKNNRNVPAGLVPVIDPFSEGDLPEVEIIVGDASKFGAAKEQIKENDDLGLYKPKVSTWGVFPRPSNISKTFGGGRVILPGDVLETAEDKAAKEALTQQLLASYKKKMGLTIDSKTKAECEKALKEGEQLMELGKLKEALPYYEKVMKDLVFQSELHGLAALQWSICQDSLSRMNEARTMYERLRWHSNVQVSKKAKQFLFGFEAMEMMKITSSSPSPKATGYQNYFEAFVEDKASYSPKEEEESEGTLKQVLPYIVFLVSPMFFMLLLAVVRKGM